MPPQIEPIYLWPENVPSWNLFQAVSTQWMAGPVGATGLNYQGVEIVMRMAEVKRCERTKYFSDIQVMERATLVAWSERRK